MATPAFTLGIEEEFQTIDPHTRELRSHLSQIVEDGQMTLHEQVKFEFSVEAANVWNHRNYEPPNMQLDSGTFGTIPELQTAEGAGPRSMELGGKIVF